MRNNHAGHMLLICKKYTENGRNIRWSSSGDTAIHSGKSVIIIGRQHGIKFRQGTGMTIIGKE
ncbi:hypothetical protein [Chitinophaga sp.]|uniref:hypothetical protein n=1 Tax=Chitinophaga sp. TaxID=1869181 RepID=UPI002F92DBD0